MKRGANTDFAAKSLIRAQRAARSRFSPKVWAGFLVILLPAASCAEREDQRFVDAKRTVEALLSDPGSAQYRDIALRPSESSPMFVCGKVNAKNRMGGYVGFQSFSYEIARGEAEIAPDYGEASTAMELGLHPDATGMIQARTRILERCLS